MNDAYCKIYPNEHFPNKNYIENINENVLNYEIDMLTFNQKEFDEVTKCKNCDHDFDNNNINEETQNNLKQYYNSLNKDGEVNVI